MTHRAGHTASSPLSAEEYDEAVGDGPAPKTYKPNAADPYDPNYGSGDQRVGLLTQAGYSWQSGSGPNAIWRSPQGQPLTEQAALDRVLTEGSKAPPQTGVGSALTFDQQKQLRSTPSYSVSQSIADPNSLALQRDQLAEQMRGNLAQEARDQQLMEFNRDKFRVETERGDRQEARATEQLMETIRSRMESNAIARAQLQQAYDLAERQIQARAAESATDRAFQGGENAANRDLQARTTAATLAQREGESLRADRTQRDAAIGQYAANPGDVGQVSALLNRPGFSNISTAIGQGETGITDRSLEPLMALLAPDFAAQQRAQQPQAPVNEFPEVPLAQQAEFTANNPNWAAQYRTGRALSEAINRGAPVPNIGGGGPAPAQQTQDMMYRLNPRETANTRMNDPANPVPDFVPRFAEGGAVMDEGMMPGKGPEFLRGLMGLIQALGMEPKAIAGEKGQPHGETVYSNGDVVVMPDEGQGMEQPMQGGGMAMDDEMMPMMMGEMMGEKKPMPKGGASKQMPEMAEGGAALNPLLAFAREFMGRTQRTALERSGFERTPTPVSLSDPGTSRYRQRAGASVAGTVGFDPGEFLAEALRLTPRGMPMGYTSRTR